MRFERGKNFDPIAQLARIRYQRVQNDPTILNEPSLIIFEHGQHMRSTFKNSQFTRF